MNFSILFHRDNKVLRVKLFLTYTYTDSYRYGPCYWCNWFYKQSLYKFLVESQLMQILLLIKFQSVSLCNFKTFSTNYILITIKIFLDLSFSASKMSGIVSGLIFKVKHNFPVANKYRSELVILNHSCQSQYIVSWIADYNLH